MWLIGLERLVNSPVVAWVLSDLMPAMLLLPLALDENFRRLAANVVDKVASICMMNANLCFVG